jgi:drug/metabolite transporter (DMT)-like permease
MRRLAVGALVCVTAIWGYTFVVVRQAIAVYPVVPFLSLRFLLAGLLLSVVLLRGGRNDIVAGVPPGVALAVGYLCQTLGLQHTTASQAGLLTGLFVVITPLLEFAVYRQPLRRATIVAVSVAFLGTAMLALPHGVDVASGALLGDALEIVTAVAFSVHLILLGRAGKGRDSGPIAVGQIWTAALGFTVGAVVSRSYAPPTAHVWSALVITALGATAVAFWVQSYVQQRLTPSRTALILVFEPAFATAFGFMLAGDSFTPVQGVGAACIFLALVGHEIALARRLEAATADLSGPVPLVEGRLGE